MGQLEYSFNWVLADRHGNIGYQMSGLMPLRREGISGLVPLEGWDAKNDWKGFAEHTYLPRRYNPEEGFIITANNDLNKWGKVSPINAPMAPYRHDRIHDIIKAADKITSEDIFKTHFDVYSLQAEKFMNILSPHLPDTPQGRILKDWDYTYSTDSKGAFLFERFYDELYSRVFGDNAMGREVYDHLSKETGIFIGFFGNFDNVLLSDFSEWFGGKSRDELFCESAVKALDVEPVAWGDYKKYTLANIFFAEKLPRFFGFDAGPVKLLGGRATVHQGQIYRSAGRTTSFCPSFRMVVDFGEDCIHTNMAGGPSDRRFSKWYCSDLDNWIEGRYKRVGAEIQ